MSRGRNWELERFVERADRLRHTRLMQKGLSTELSYTFDGRTSPNFIQGRLRQPDEDDLKAFLVDFRPFVLQREPVYVARVYNQIERRLTDTTRRDVLRISRERWKHGQGQGGFQFFLNESSMSPAGTPVLG